MGAGARALGAKGPEMWKEGGEPLSGNTGQRGAGLASFTPSLVLSPLAPCLAPTTQPTPHTPKRGFQSPAGTTPILPWTTPTLPFISFPQRSLGRASRPRPTQRAAHSCPVPRAALLPFLPTSIQRNRGHATSTVCPSAEDGQQLVLSHSPWQPAEKSSSIRQALNVDAPPPEPSTPPHLCLVLPPTSLPRIIWSQRDAKLHLR